MKKAISILLVLFVTLSLCACNSTDSTPYDEPTTPPTEDTSIDTSSEALTVAEQYLRGVLPQLCSAYEYSTGTQLWGWNTSNYMLPTSNGWKGELRGSFQLVTYAGIDDVKFDAIVEIDNSTGTIRLLDVDIDD